MQLSKVTYALVAAGVVGGLATFYQQVDGLAVSPAHAAIQPAAVAPAVIPTAAANLPDFTALVDRVSPAVVNISVRNERKVALDADDDEDAQGDPMREFFKRFGGPTGPQMRPQPTQGMGSGFIVSNDGYIVTNAHVVDDASEVTVKLTDRREFTAKVVGSDKRTDIALIKIDAKDLPALDMSAKPEVKRGEWVIAIGSPFGFESSVSAGVVSGVHRALPNGQMVPFIQTDVAVNPGNSGGPLLNLRGEVVGINTAIISEGRPGNVGVGFAMPINVVRELLPQLRAGKITRGRIGVGIGPIPADAVDEFGLKDRNGAVVLNVAPGGAAAKAGIEPGDVVIAYNGKVIRNRDELVAMVTATRPGTTVPVRIVRDRQERNLNVTVEELDLDAETASQRACNDSGGAPGQPETTSGFGITIGNITPEIAQRLRLNRNTSGAVVLGVEQGGAAARAGLAEGDVIVRVGRENVANATEASREMGRVPSGGTAFLRVLRGGQETFVAVTKE